MQYFTDLDQYCLIKRIFFGCFLWGLLTFSLNAQERPFAPWLNAPSPERLVDRISEPKGAKRIPLPSSSFGYWLRNLPTIKGDRDVRLYNGRKKQNQRAHHVILNIDTGKKDLQQCADAVIRLRAEYLYYKGCDHQIAFNFTSGDKASLHAWQKGFRPLIKNNKVRFLKKGRLDRSYDNFRAYLETVFIYAGSMSLSKELMPQKDPFKLMPGDVFIQGGFPGHAVIVMDVAEARENQRYFLLAQSFMPAQEIHILKNPNAENSPWYLVQPNEKVMTPEWVFSYKDLKKFQVPGCR